MEIARIITSRMEPLVRDIRFALRRLRRAPGFTVFAVGSLALGIGVSTAIYSAVRTLLWMPLGIAEADGLVAIGSPRGAGMSWPDFQELRAQQTTCSAVAAAVTIRTALRVGSVSQTVFGEAVSGQFFTVMGLRPRYGRLLDAQDEASGARVVVLSEAFWRTRLQSDPAVVGRSVSVGGQPFEVVGVAAGTFRGLVPVRPESVWVPVTALASDPHAFSVNASLMTDRAVAGFIVWARLRPGAALSRLDAESALMAQRLNATYPPGRTAAPREWGARFQADVERRGSEFVRTVVTAVMVAIAIVLLIACTNLANLALARGTARAQETAVRTALGASRWRLVREQLIESALVVGCGASASIVVLRRLVDYLSTDLPMGRGIAIPFRPEIDMPVLVASLFAAALALLVFGLWPAVQSTRADVRQDLGSGTGATPPKWRLHRNLIAWQVCGSVALLLVAVMSVRIVGEGAGSWTRARYQDLAVAQVDFTLNGVDEAHARATIGAVMEDLRSQRALERVGASNGSPSSLFGAMRPVTTPAEPFEADRPSRGKIAAIAAVTPDFLATMDIRTTRGRGFTDRDDAGARLVGIVTESLARDLFQTAEVVGRTILLAPMSRLVTSAGAAAPAARTSLSVTIVGVSSEVRTSPTSTQGDRILFVPFAQQYEARAPVLIIARASEAPAAVARLRTAIRQAAPNLVLSAAGTGAVLLEGPFFLLRVIGALAAALGALALVLAMAGLFGILTHVVERRTREIGIRLAIGADRGQILRLVLRDGLHPVLKGLVLGLAIGLGSRVVLRGELFTTISAWDPLEFCVLPLVFLVAALVACALPAARASRVDPNVALRDL
jgi:predicted permease